MAATPNYRVELASLMVESVAEQEEHRNYTYEEVRPQDVQYTVAELTTPAGDPVFDCSDGVRALCHAVGVADDPAGNGYQDYGNSSSIWAHLHHIDLSEVQPGDIFTFGFWTGEQHACMAHRLVGGEWEVWNMGGPGQPILDTLQNEIDYHQGTTLTCCLLNVPEPPPTPQEKLRAETGFYSWVAWRLGEGPWKHYGAKNASVRPNVPKVIPARWWVRYAQFLRNRRQPNHAVAPPA